MCGANGSDSFLWGSLSSNYLVEQKQEIGPLDNFQRISKLSYYKKEIEVTWIWASLLHILTVMYIHSRPQRALSHTATRELLHSWLSPSMGCILGLHSLIIWVFDKNLITVSTSGGRKRRGGWGVLWMCISIRSNCSGSSYDHVLLAFAWGPGHMWVHGLCMYLKVCACCRGNLIKQLAACVLLQVSGYQCWTLLPLGSDSRFIHAFSPTFQQALR